MEETAQIIEGDIFLYLGRWDLTRNNLYKQSLFHLQIDIYCVWDN
jgi:hypothetical protein